MPHPTKTSALRYSAVVVGCLFGCLARNVLVDFVPSSTGTSKYYYWLTKEWQANFLGCFLMGMMLPWKPSKLHFLKTGLTVGFCGSLTAWASMSTGARTDVLTNGEHSATWLLKISLNLSLCYVVYLLGTHMMSLCIALRIYHKTPLLESARGSRTSSRMYGSGATVLEPDHLDLGRIIDGRANLTLASRRTATALKVFFPMSLLLYGVALCVALVTLHKVNRAHRWAFACIVAPFGALARYGLSTMNLRSKTFPAPNGTYIANTSAVLISALCLR
eukprot:Blabericola_migrator_1__3099@NODE_18_length_22925_cov_118_464826_g15_i0_p9_GENE_NODE_18_length_22925_cov_118_464826_g15_i0NODE_18_length_22925_cov_118_464826_g15_i0_p9_ORF_typecomplete_len276_score12_82CRCB/PF02537_15/1_1e12CRCB/PF02537_15/5_5e03CRCB/PF02537_15/0_00177TMRDISM_7TM/PF07695_11/7_4e027TMRDISM_7TM/PF07695_11/0_018DUF308/PF03729_13/1_4e04DUF308/PF03729_13/0_13FtsX/PF02687_21/65DUF4131/PF13567_6/49DUF4131/PF13567_6/2_8_NODE_18_length_22925_cov_118_464826_g15_i039774804